MNNILISLNPAYRPDREAATKNEGVALGQGQYAYCFEGSTPQESTILSPEACAKNVQKAQRNQLPDLSAWGLDNDRSQFPDAMDSGLPGLDQWNAMSRFENALDNFDLETTKLHKDEGVRGPYEAYNIQDGEGNILAVRRDTLQGNGVSVEDRDGQMKLKQDDLSSLSELMRVGAENTGSSQQFEEGIKAIEASKPAK